MFDLSTSEKSPILRAVIRAVFSLGAGAILTFTLPELLDAITRNLPIEHRNSLPVLIIVSILNLPAVIYCNLFTLPDGLPKSDESLYCWAVGFFYNIPYYAVVIYFLTWWFAARRAKKRQIADSPLT